VNLYYRLPFKRYLSSGKLNGKTVKIKFQNDLPLMEIASTENTFTGYSAAIE
jgi:hypothetical protein